ncbi:MAG: GNAT family N-acetyltransferase [Solobacterium sp.]|nr:GNAT family N-acetyltransferase [Solobacterium sp.]
MLETERLRLRPWQESDAEDCFRYASDERVGPRAGWKVHKSIEDSLSIIRNILMVEETYAIVLKETGHVIGSISLHKNDLAEKEDEMELGFWLGVEHWGKGLMQEAAIEVIRHAFIDLQLNRIWCAYYDGNLQSKRLQEKLGFTYQWTNESVPVTQMNEVRIGHVNLMTKEDWLKMQV